MPDKDVYKIEVFKTGTHTSMNGVTKTYTVDDLKAWADKYNAQAEYKAPLVLGHPKVDDPAFGWAEKFEVVGQKLVACVSDVSDKLKQAVKVGMFRNVSIAVFADGLIRHIGFLGATPPAVQGLAPVQFATDKEFLEFAWATDEWRMPTVGALFRGLRDWIIEKFDLDTADKVIPSSAIDHLMEPAPSTYIPKETTDNNFATKEDHSTMTEQEIKDFKAMQDSLTALTTQFAGMKAENDALKTKLSEGENALILQQKKNEQRIASVQFAAFVDGLIRDGKVLPGEKDALEAEFADVYMANSQLTFAQGEKSLVDKFKDRLTARPVTAKPSGEQFASRDKAKTVDLAKVPSEFAHVGEQVQAFSLDLDAQIQAYASEHKCSYEVAAVQFGATGGND